MRLFKFFWLTDYPEPRLPRKAASSPNSSICVCKAASKNTKNLWMNDQRHLLHCTVGFMRLQRAHLLSNSKSAMWMGNMRSFFFGRIVQYIRDI